MHRRTRSLLACIVMFLPGLAEASGPDAAAPLQAAHAAAAQAPRPDAVDAEAQALLDRWLAAQSSGLFAEYMRLYSPGFRGVRRSGDKRVELDLNGWRADRERMFRKSMAVAVSRVEARRTSPDVMRVSFWQEFSSGRYKDRGQKEMELRRLDGQWLIEREEMLSSERVSVPGIAPINLPLTIEGCAGEYCNCVTSDRLRKALELRERPDDASRVVATLKPKAKIEGADFLRIVRRVGSVKLTDGKRLHFLGYASEGAYIGHNGKDFVQFFDSEVDEIEDSGVIEDEWVRITYRGGQKGYAPGDGGVAHGYYGYRGTCVFGSP